MAAPLIATACRRPAPPTPEQARLTIASAQRATFASCAIAFSAPKPELKILIDADDSDELTANEQMVCFPPASSGDSAGARCRDGLVAAGLAQPSKEAPDCARKPNGKLTIGADRDGTPRVDRLVARCELDQLVVDDVKQTGDDTAEVSIQRTLSSEVRRGLERCGGFEAGAAKETVKLVRDEHGRWTVGK